MFTALFILLALGLLSSNAQQPIGYCQVKGTANDPGVFGSIVFIQNNNLVDMVVNVYNITVNRDRDHGIHIHQYGDISSPTALQTGTHWNPTNTSHGCRNSATRHYGDTGNWRVSQQGAINEVRTYDLMQLTGNYSVIGLAVIVHATTDDCLNTTSSGARLAQCVIGIANPAYFNNQTNTAAASNVPRNSTERAICVLEPTANNTVYGWVLFEQANSTAPVTVTGTFYNLAPGSRHGLHIHQYGDLRSADATATGGHWNPNGTAHGIPGYMTHHAGDLGNIFFYTSNGTAHYSFSANYFGLSGSLYNALGHAVVVHIAPDVCTQPTGGSGSRMAQCVIGIANPTTVLTIPGNVPANQDFTPCLPIVATSSVPTSVTGATGGATGLDTTGEASSSSVLVISLISMIIASLF